jgi:transcription elongation factor
MVGKKARITEGPNKGRIGVISAVNADGSVIIDIQ